MDQYNVSSNDIAPNCDPVGKEGGKTGNTEQYDSIQRETHLGHDQSTHTDTKEVVEECVKCEATSDAGAIASGIVEPQQGSMGHMSLTGRSSSSSQLDDDQSGMDCGDVGNGDVEPNPDGETNIVVVSPTKEHNAYETGDGRTARHEVVVDGIILSESDSEAGDSDNEAKCNVLQSSDSDGGSLAVDHVSSPRRRHGNDSRCETVKKTSEKGADDEQGYSLRPSSSKEEQVYHCLQHGYELGKKTDSLQFAKIHRGRVTEGKLEASVKIRDMIFSAGHHQASLYIELYL